MEQCAIELWSCFISHGQLSSHPTLERHHVADGVPSASNVEQFHERGSARSLTYTCDSLPYHSFRSTRHPAAQKPPPYTLFYREKSQRLVRSRSCNTDHPSEIRRRARRRRRTGVATSEEMGTARRERVSNLSLDCDYRSGCFNTGVVVIRHGLA